jgi:AcrR family transcriptional regulator
MEPKLDRPVKPPSRRRYDASRRQEQARANRAAVLAAARRRFLANGYAATTLAAVAADADVSVETIYKAFGNKPGLLKSVVDVAIVGDDEPVPLMDREFVQRNMAEPDGRRKLEMYAEHFQERAARSMPLSLLARDAAASDPGAAAVWEQLQTERLTGMAHFAAHLHAGRHLRRGVTAAEARDVLWAYTSPELWDILVVRRGWTPARFATWQARALIAALLPAVGPAPRG